MRTKGLKSPDMKDFTIIDAFPAYDVDPIVLNVGCGDGSIDFLLATMGYRVYSVDNKKYDTWRNSEKLSFHISDIFDLSSFPVSSAPIVICSQVLEHLRDWRGALANLLSLTSVRLIITIPYRKSFGAKIHCNFWDDFRSGEFLDIHEFETLCRPWAVAISKMRTKLQDANTDNYNYLITVDKRQDIVKRETK